MEAKAHLKYLRISPRKVSILCDIIRGKDAKTACVYLMQTPKAASEPMLKLLKTKDDLIDGAELYLRIYFLGMPASALYNYGSGVLNAIGNTKTPLLFLSVAGVLNVILALAFVIGLGMSTDGVAIKSMKKQSFKPDMNK